MRGLASPHPILGATPPAQGQYTNSGCRVVHVSLYGPSYLTVTCSLFSLVRQWILFTSVYIGFCWNRDRYAQCYCACFWRLHICSSWTRCARTSLCNDRCRLVRTSLLWRRGSSPWSSSSCSRCSSRTRLLLCPLLVNDRCRSSAVAVFTVVDTPVFAQWLIPMVLSIEISQLQFDMVVFVPVVQVCSSIQ